MEEIKYVNTGLRIATTRKDSGEYNYLKVNYLFFLESENDIFRNVLTIADYFYESIQLIIMNQVADRKIDDKSAKEWIGYFNLLRHYICLALLLCNKKTKKIDPKEQEKLRDNIKKTSSKIADAVSQANGDLIRELESSLLRDEEGKEKNVDCLCEKLRKQCEELKNQIEELKKESKKWKNRFKNLNGEKVGPKCVALAIDKVSKQYYFSLSGSSIDCVTSIQILHIKKEWKYVSYMINAYETIRKVIGSLQPDNKGITDCHLTDNVRRYADASYVMDAKGEQTIKIDKYLDKPIRFIEDQKNASKINSVSNGVNLNRHYSCCERKILAYIVGFSNPDYAQDLIGKTNNILSDFRFLISKIPCPLCRPALVGCTDIIYDYPFNPHSVKWNGKEFETNP